MGDVNRIQADLGINMRLYLKNIQRKKSWGMAQVVGHLPGKHKALISIS
jgi:hypothetical protein